LKKIYLAFFYLNPKMNSMIPSPSTIALTEMRRQYQTGFTKSYDFRKAQLEKLKQSILTHEEALYEALYKDLKKNRESVWVTEIGMVLNELQYAIKNLKSWMKKQPATTNLVNLPSSSYTIQEPLGVCLIISPWNYPLQLSFLPLIGAIAAGNCVVLKPSEVAQATEAVMKKIVTECFPENYIYFVQGDGAVVVPDMMKNFRFDYVFFTGSTAVGKTIYRLAAETLCPVTLELGGKSPCIVAPGANIAIAARRIALTKFSNCGQMCVAPDYLLVHSSLKDELVAALKNCIHSFYSSDPESSNEYGKIINKKQFDRLISYLNEGRILHGGTFKEDSLFIEPTLIDNIPTSASIWKEEIFGPILPVISYQTREDAMKIIDMNPNPLAFYVYSNHAEEQDFWTQSLPFGGGCINNSSWHLTNHNLPFGGRGLSGIGQYHGKYSFDTFSHKKAIMKTPTWFDPSVRYPPLKGKLNLFKKII
jgi:aldehyde dehydrogenase (NAD+)